MYQCRAAPSNVCVRKHPQENEQTSELAVVLTLFQTRVSPGYACSTKQVMVTNKDRYHQHSVTKAIFTKFQDFDTAVTMNQNVNTKICIDIFD